MNDIPEVLEEPLLRSSGRLYQDIPLVPLKVFVFSVTDTRAEWKGITYDPPETYQRSKTGSPVLVYP